MNFTLGAGRKLKSSYSIREYLGKTVRKILLWTEKEKEESSKWRESKMQRPKGTCLLEGSGGKARRNNTFSGGLLRSSGLRCYASKARNMVSIPGGEVKIQHHTAQPKISK